MLSNACTCPIPRASTPSGDVLCVCKCVFDVFANRLLVVSEIDRIGRFRSPKKLHAYAELVPSTYSGKGRTFHGRIIKSGNKYLRWAMVEAVWPAIQKKSGVESVLSSLGGS